MGYPMLLIHMTLSPFTNLMTDVKYSEAIKAAVLTEKHPVFNEERSDIEVEVCSNDDDELEGWFVEEIRMFFHRGRYIAVQKLASASL